MLICWHIIRNCSLTYMSTGDITCSEVQGTYFTIFLRNPILPVHHLGPGAIQLLREGEEPKSAIGRVRCTWTYSAVQNPHAGRLRSRSLSLAVCTILTIGFVKCLVTYLFHKLPDVQDVLSSHLWRENICFSLNSHFNNTHRKLCWAE